MYARVIRQSIEPRALEEAKHETPDVSNVPGFHAYYVVDLGKGQYATIGVFEDKGAAEEWARRSRQYVKQRKLKKHLSGANAGGFGGHVVYSRSGASVR
jgi:heme-degrading monooxygenase HmoA